MARDRRPFPFLRATTCVLALTTFVVAAAHAPVVEARTPAPSVRATLATGWRFVMRVTSASTGPRGRPMGGRDQGDRTMTVLLQGGRARIEQGGAVANPMMPKDGYMLMDGKAGRMLIVNPAEKKVLVMSGDALAAGPAGQMMQIDVDDLVTNVRELGAGATILGYRTRKYRVNQSYVMRVSGMGQSRSIRNVLETDAEVSAELAAVDPGFEEFGKRFTRGVADGSPGMRKLAEAAKQWPRGFALRTRTSQLTIDGADTLRSTSDMQVTEMKQLTIDPAVLQVPAGYEEIDLNRLMQGGRRGARGKPPGMPVPPRPPAGAPARP
jgi:hypothetical protein